MLFGFWIAEWGVIVPDSGRSVALNPGMSFLLNEINPKKKELDCIVHKPLIYFYGELPDSLTLHLGLSEIGIAYPPPQDSAEGFTWRIRKPYSDTLPEYESLLRVLFGNIGSQSLLVGDSVISFIYYDAPLVFRDSVEVKVKKQEVRVRNRHSFMIYNIYYCIDTQRIFYLDSLPPGERASLVWGSPPELNRIMRGLGFSFLSSNQFAQCWDREICKPGTLFYRLPQEKTDALIPITVSPEPERTLRAMWVLIRKGAGS